MLFLNKMNNRGSVLVLLVVVVAIVTALGSSLLNIVFANYDIKRFNTESKRAYYLSENGLNESYVRTRCLIKEAIEDSVDKTELYLIEYPLNEEAAKNIFKTNYKQYLTANIKSQINRHGNPSVEIRNLGSLIFISDVLIVSLRSAYVLDEVEKITWVELNISVPEFDDVNDEVYDVKDYIEFGNWNS